MKTKLFQILIYVNIMLIAIGCQSKAVHKVNSTPVEVPEEVLQGILAFLTFQKGRNTRARYEEKYYCYVDELFILDLNEPGEEQGSIRYEGMTTLFSVDRETGLIEFMPTDFEMGKWSPLIYIEDNNGRILYWIELDFEVLRRT